jgi:hypothetical protein
MGVSRPVGRVLCPAHAGRRSSIWDCRCRQPRAVYPRASGGPPSIARAGSRGSPLDLAPGGVYRAAAVTCGAGGLLHHRFTLTSAGAEAVCFLWHCPAGHPGSALPTTLSCGARTFLTGLAPGATARPTHPCSGYAERHRAGVTDRDGPPGAAPAAGSEQGHPRSLILKIFIPNEPWFPPWPGSPRSAPYPVLFIFAERRAYRHRGAARCSVSGPTA